MERRSAAKYAFGLLAAMLLVLFPPRLFAVEATLTADAHVSASQPSVNAGTLSNLNVGGGYTTLVRFDLGVLPTGTSAAQVAKATLRLYCNRADTPGAVNLQPVYGGWSEGSVTFSSLPVLGTPTGTVQVNAAGSFVTVDVTAIVQGWMNAPGSNYGLALSSTDAVVQFDSKENDTTAHEPELELALSSTSSAMGGAGLAGSTGVAGSAGATGATGATGVAGVAGPAGAPGAVGATGATGATGPAGPAGAGLVNYKGTYNSTTNYSNGDVVQFGGSTYISQTAANHGNTPGQASAWGLLASAGSPGVTGPAGTTGATGQQGPPGYGVQGTTGATGVTGATGAAGSPGLVYQGAYSSTANYALGDVVLWNGASFVSLMGQNHGNTPGLVPGTWGALTAQGPIGLAGATGATGAAGATGALGPVGPPGERGNQGPQGIPGQAGAQGLPGATGATGLQGPMGATGAAGPVGMSFQGSYVASANYSVGQAVLWQGAGWVSLQNGNHGNTPDQSPAAWAMFAAAGTTGSVGTTGAPGLPGATGATGLAGVNGSNGATGATGTTGAPGLVYQGSYSSTTSYNVGDVVLWNGASYTSLIGSNRGNTPGAVLGTWGVLTAPGPAGPQGNTGQTGLPGATGAVGPMGSVGPQGPQGAPGIMGAAGSPGATGPAGAVGPQGATGATGAAGPVGAPGLAGATGATGLQGPMGTTGAAGPVGMSFAGAYSAGTNYALGQGVLWQGAGWVSLVSGNRGNTPDQSPGQWAMFAAPGATGNTGATGVGLSGATGATGSAGAQGPAGIPGATGATGATGLHFVGAYSSAYSYGLGDAVAYNGASYISLLGSNHGQAPDGSPSAWAILAAQGAPGLAGPMGSAGATGATGAQGAAGPAGAVGSTGATGAQGAVGMAFRGTWGSTTNYAPNDVVTFAGSSYLAASANRGQEPDQAPQVWAVLAEAGGVGPMGVAGATGLPGIAASVTVGSVTVLPVGAQPTVTNSGSSAAAVLNFGFPQAASSGGSTASTQPQMMAMYHAVNYNSLYYAVNSTNASATETATVLAWVPRACTATRLDVFSQQTAVIKVTLRVGSATSLNSTVLSCSAATNGSCSATGAVSVTAGQFMDLYIQFASSTTTPVWTAVECDPAQ